MDKWMQVAARLLKNAYFWTPGHVRRTEQAIATALSAAHEAGRREEREACARLAETEDCGEAEEGYGDGYSDACFYLATAIRSREDKA